MRFPYPVSSVVHHIAYAVTLACLTGLAPACPAAEPAADRGAIDPEAIKNLEAAYPKATAGRTRHVILLPHKERGEEENFKVEIIAGRTIDTDGANQYRLGGDFREKDIPGWGFSYFEVDALGGPLSTRIATVPGTEPVRQFVAGPRLLVRYNSRLPLVVYAHEGTEIRSRVWRAEGEPLPAEQR